MRSILVLSAAALSLAACTVAPAPVANPLPPVVVTPPVAPVTPATDVSRAAAVSIVNREMAQRLPGTNVTPYTTCVVNNATQAELADIASLGAGSPAVASAVASIVQRSSTSSCIAGLRRTA